MSQAKFIDAPLPTTNPWGKTQQQPSQNSQPQAAVENFPSLPRSRAPTRPTTHQTITATSSSNQQIERFNNLNGIFKELNSLVNIRELTRAVTDLTAAMRTAKTKIEKVMVYNDFILSLDDYDI